MKHKICIILILLFISNNNFLLFSKENKQRIYVSAYGNEDNPEGKAFIKNISNFQEEYPEY